MVKMEDKLPLKHKALQILTQAGLSTTEAGKALGYNKNVAHATKSKLNRKVITNPQLVNKTHKCVKTMVDDFDKNAKNGNTIAKPNEIIDLYKEQMKRIVPVVTVSRNLNVDISFSEVSIIQTPNAKLTVDNDPKPVTVEKQTKDNVP